MRVATIQVRTGSTRLPGKALMPLGSCTLIQRVIRRVRLSGVDEVVLATTAKPEDDVLVEIAAYEGIRWHRGSETDCLSRIWNAQKGLRPDVSVVVWGDTPLIDPRWIDAGINLVEGGVCDLAMDRGGMPNGVATHVVRSSVLKKWNRRARQPKHREHVTLGLHDGTFPCGVHEFIGSGEMAGQRLQVDYAEDYEVVRRIQKFFGERDDFGTAEIVGYLRSNPDVCKINADCVDTVI